MEQKFIKCNTCGTMINYIDEKATPVCCGEPMVAAEYATGHEATHVPVYEINGTKVKVTVGDGTHPITADHHIQWVSLESANCVQRKELSLLDEIVDILFMIPKDDELQSIHVYCNKHGLYKNA